VTLAGVLRAGVARDEHASRHKTTRRRNLYIAATPNPRALKSAERGTQIDPLGANSAVNPREAQALLALARQLTPPADERERILRYLRLLAPAIAALALPTVAQAAVAVPSGSGTATSGAPAVVNGGAGLSPGKGRASTASQPTVRGFRAKIIKGVAYAPSNAPLQVQKIIWAGNKIRHKPYVFGGGHGVWNDVGYDCSGSVSYVLHAAGLLKVSMDSSQFESWGSGGAGQWVTVYTNPAHAFIQVAGIRFDTSAEDDPHPPPGTGPRWRPDMDSTRGFQSRHPSNL
jgi:cell wall-associated NlpC family hydrolase